MPLSKSLITLLLVNMLPIFGVMFFGWNISSIIFLYWFENIVVGFYNVLKIALAKLPSTTKSRVNGKLVPTTKTFTILFFIIHFGFFTFGHGVFVFNMFLKEFQLNQGILIAMISLMFSHGVSYLTNYIGKKEFENVSPDRLMISPYKRIVVMHLTVIFSGMFAVFVGESASVLLIMIILKTAIDILSHLNEHKHFKNIKIGSTTIEKMPNKPAVIRSAITNKLIQKLAFRFQNEIDETIEKSIVSGNFDELSENMDPRDVKMVKDYYKTRIAQKK